MVGDAGQNVSLGNKLKKTAELFDIISNNGDVDHPLCEECTDTLLERLVEPPKMFTWSSQFHEIFVCFFFDRVILPSKLSIDSIGTLNKKSFENLELIFEALYEHSHKITILYCIKRGH